MMKMDERIRVLILRTLGLDQDEVVAVLHCAKLSVVEVEKWFKAVPLDEALALLDEHRIKRLIDRDLEDLELEPTDFIKAGRITADDILMRYGHVSPASAIAEEVAVVPAYAVRLEEHWSKLRQLAEALRGQLSAPSTRQLFAAEVCDRVHAAADTGAPLLPTEGWRGVFDAPFEVRAAADSGEASVEARVLAQGEFLFPSLVSHMKAESREFSRMDEWQSQLGEVVALCLDRARDVTFSCSAAAGLPYIRAGLSEWLSYQFPAYVCQVALEHPGVEDAPVLVTEAEADGSWRLTPRDCPAITLAGGTASADARCREAFAAEIRRNAGVEMWHDIAAGLTALEADAAPLRQLLTTVIVRGDFRGTCALCESYFSSSRDS